MKTFVFVRIYEVDAPNEETAKVQLETAGESETYIVDEKIFEEANR